MDAKFWLSWWEWLKCESVQCQQEHTLALPCWWGMQWCLCERATCWPSVLMLINKVEILIKLIQKQKHMSFYQPLEYAIILSLSRILPIDYFNGIFELWPARSWFHRSVNLHYCISNNSLAWPGWDDSSPQPASITVRKKDLESSQTRSNPCTPHIHTWRETHLANHAQFHMQTKLYAQHRKIILLDEFTHAV